MARTTRFVWKYRGPLPRNRRLCQTNGLLPPARIRRKRQHNSALTVQAVIVCVYYTALCPDMMLLRDHTDSATCRRPRAQACGNDDRHVRVACGTVGPRCGIRCCLWQQALHGGLVPVDPVTPDIHQACSKRAFDGQVRKWRRKLHAWDPVEEGDDPSGPAAPAVGLTSPGAGKRGASARTPATAGRRKVGRIGGEEEEEEGKGGAVPAQPAFGEVADVAPC